MIRMEYSRELPNVPFSLQSMLSFLSIMLFLGTVWYFSEVNSLDMKSFEVFQTQHSMYNMPVWGWVDHFEPFPVWEVYSPQITRLPSRIQKVQLDSNTELFERFTPELMSFAHPYLKSLWQRSSLSLTEKRQETDQE